VEADILAAAAPVGRGDVALDNRRILRRVPFVGLRRTIADRLRTSLTTAATTTITREVGADVLVAARARLSEAIKAALPFDALFIKLLATTLRVHPELNATIANDEILVFDDVHIGFAVSVRGGLVVPVVRHADREPLGAVAALVRELGERAQAGRLRPEENVEGTATISNLGAYGVDAFTPILNPPQSLILGIGRIVPRPIVLDGQLALGRTCFLSLTFDHRVADGAPAAQVLESVAQRMLDESYLMTLA
jgi:pyruvate dehydrogenase E2 component (dihydrolipoamide acetyltransferase)